MKKIILLIAFFSISNAAFSQSAFEGFFSPLEKLQDDATEAEKKTNKFRPVIVLPAFKIVESSRSDAKIDAQVLTSTGGGVSYQMLKYDKDKEAWKSYFTWSPLTILLSGDTDDSLDVSYATTFGFFNNAVMIGGGYDFGSVGDRSRWFGLISIGINFNN
ncbi:MAG: hypothetical protein RLN81_05205 [Balneolaceae bacterium]